MATNWFPPSQLIDPNRSTPEMIGTVHRSSIALWKFRLDLDQIIESLECPCRHFVFSHEAIQKLQVLRYPNTWLYGGITVTTTVCIMYKRESILRSRDARASSHVACLPEILPELLGSEIISIILVGGRHFGLFCGRLNNTMKWTTYVSCMQTIINIFSRPPAMTKGRPPTTMLSIELWSSLNLFVSFPQSCQFQECSISFHSHLLCLSIFLQENCLCRPHLVWDVFHLHFSKVSSCCCSLGKNKGGQ